MEMLFMGVKKTTKIFKKEVYDLVGKEYEVLGEYVTGRTKIKIKHNGCGAVYEVYPHDFLAGNRCPKCRYTRISKKSRKSFNQFKQEVLEQGKGEYTVEPPYVNNKVKMKFTHLTCGTSFMMKPNAFLCGHRCPKCSLEKRASLTRKATSEFIKDVDACYGVGEYIVLGNYEGADIPIKVKHSKCGNIYESRPADLIRGHGCPKCAYKTRASKIGVNQRMSLDEVQKSVNQILGKDYHILLKPEEYKGNRQVITIKHDKCGFTYSTRYSDIQCFGYGCPYCKDNKSHGEMLIFNYFIKKLKMTPGKDFYYGYTGFDMKYKNKLNLDFYIPKYKVAIEYDGLQHFKPIKLYGGLDKFKESKNRDCLKDRYCIDNGILLFRIPYCINSINKMTSYLNDILSYTGLFSS